MATGERTQDLVGGPKAAANPVPDQCPMCAGIAWDFTDWRAFSSQKEVL